MAHTPLLVRKSATANECSLSWSVWWAHLCSRSKGECVKSAQERSLVYSDFVIAAVSIVVRSCSINCINTYIYHLKEPKWWLVFEALLLRVRFGLAVTNFQMVSANQPQAPELLIFNVYRETHVTFVKSAQQNRVEVHNPFYNSH